MRNFLYVILCTVIAAISFSSCNDEETYAEQKEREADLINAYIAKNGINVIDENQFHNQGDSTIVEQNQYVLFENIGVYMQIIDKGCGEILKSGETSRLLCRFTEYNINRDSLTLSNKNNVTNATRDDVIMVVNNSGTFTAQFETGAMAYYYNNTEVPAGWLVPLSYIRIGRQKNEGDRLAHVKLIVPHSQGHASATTNVHAYTYDITYQRGI